MVTIYFQLFILSVKGYAIIIPFCLNLLFYSITSLFSPQASIMSPKYGFLISSISLNQ